MQKYDPKKIEGKWQKAWAKSGIYKTETGTKKPKCYVLDMFPYPSGEGLHVGHPKGYIATDIYSRHKKMSGFNVLHPMGWDAFGLPAENYAIKMKVNPMVMTKKNVAHYKQQLSVFGCNYDWSREINTTDPEYYKWTQWAFIKMFEKGLAYESYEPINWCPSCKTGLALEDLEDGKCERCGSVVEKKPMRQWVLKITDYAERLLKDLDGLNWPESIKEAQRNWIGKSEGSEISFELKQDLSKHNFVFLHAYKDNSKSAFWPWLKKKIESRGGRVYAPDLPDTENPKVEDQVQYVLDNYVFTPNTIIITHSLGGPVAMKLIPRLKTPIEKLIMMAPPLRPEFADKKPRPHLASVCDWNFDFEVIKNKVKKIIVVRDSNDHIVPPNHPKEIAERLRGEFRVGVGQKTHFNGEVEPNVLEAVIPTVKVFTTRADTLFGCTYVVLAPEHEIIKNLKLKIKNWEEVDKYIKKSAKETEIDRTSVIKAKTGVKLEGIMAINPANSEEVPVFIADYVLASYGTGAVMAVPAHDERDWDFAKKYNLPVKKVIEYPEGFPSDKPYIGEGIVINSTTWANGLLNIDAAREIVEELEYKGVAKFVTKYKLRDWVFSRQRYWGEPIPIIHCDQCGVVPVPEKDLPVELPKVKNYEPTGTGESPLAGIAKWVNVKCPKCGDKGKRETNTMPQWAGSSWYYLRYLDPQNKKALVDKKKEAYWSPVDMYVGGTEHATRHLIYARFWHKFLFDIGAVNYEEPFAQLKNQGLISGSDGRKMSKRWGNVINPDDMIASYGADTLRVYEMFMGPFEQGASWSTDSMIGSRRFLDRIWKLADKIGSNKIAEDLEIALHKTIKKVGEDIDQFAFNTAISTMMVLSNEMDKAEQISKKSFEDFLKILAPFAPHITEELWSNLGHNQSIHLATWPTYDKTKLQDKIITIVVQVNGKVRVSFEIEAGAKQAEVEKLALEQEMVKKWVVGQTIRKFIYIQDKLLNIVI